MIMGTFTQSITLMSASADDTATLDAWVDTGATFTSVPAAVLERLGVVPHRTVALRMASGVLERRRIGLARAELDGVQESIICVFGDANDPPAIGAHTLEACLLAVDPVNQRLVPVEALWI